MITNRISTFCVQNGINESIPNLQLFFFFFFFFYESIHFMTGSERSSYICRIWISWYLLFQISISTLSNCSEFCVEHWLLCCDLSCKWVTCWSRCKRFWKQALHISVYICCCRCHQSSTHPLQPCLNQRAGPSIHLCQERQSQSQLCAETQYAWCYLPVLVATFGFSILIFFLGGDPFSLLFLNFPISSFFLREDTSL